MSRDNTTRGPAVRIDLEDRRALAKLAASVGAQVVNLNHGHGSLNPLDVTAGRVAESDGRQAGPTHVDGRRTS